MQTALSTRAKIEPEIPRPKRLPWVVAGIGVAAMTTGVALDRLVAGSIGSQGRIFDALMLYLLFVSLPLFGAVVLRRMPDNRLGWVFLFLGLVAGVGFLGQTYARIGLVIEPGRWPLASFAAWIEQWWWYPAFGSILLFFPLLFPDGRPASPRWRIVGWTAGICLGVVTLGGMLEGRLTGDGYSIDNPIGIGSITDVEEHPIFGIFTIAFVGCSLLAVVSLFARYRRAGTEQRQQLKWFMSAITLLIVGSIAGDAFDLPEILFPIMVLMLMASIAVSVLKYRLYDIDIIINRALVYGVLSAALLGSYVLGVFGLSRLVDPITQDSDVAVAASTLAVAALFRPLRARIQGFIDQRFYRSKYDAARAVALFAGRLRDEIEVEEVRSDVLQVVSDTLAPRHASLWLPERAN